MSSTRTSDAVAGTTTGRLTARGLTLAYVSPSPGGGVTGDRVDTPSPSGD